MTQFVNHKKDKVLINKYIYKDKFILSIFILLNNFNFNKTLKK